MARIGLPLGAGFYADDEEIPDLSSLFGQDRPEPMLAGDTPGADIPSDIGQTRPEYAVAPYLSRPPQTPWERMGTSLAEGVAPFQPAPYEGGLEAFLRGLVTGGARGYGSATESRGKEQAQLYDLANLVLEKRANAKNAARRDWMMYALPGLIRAATPKAEKAPGILDMTPEQFDLYQKRYKQLHPPSSGGSMFGLPSGSMDPAAVADAVYEGKFAPTDVNTRSVFGGAVLSQLRKRHPDYDKKRADMAWRAMSQLTSTQNQNRITALRQSMTSTRMHLQRARDLNAALDEAGVPRGTMQEANRFSLEAAVRGVYGRKVAVLASQFMAQVPLMQSDFATVFSNGFAPTEDSYKLAQKMIRMDLPSRQVSGNLDNIDKDIAYKVSALDQLSPMVPGQSGLETPPSETNAAATVKMRAPNGQVKEVPASQRSYWEAKGAKVVR